jgi:hypothetical protein
MSNDVLQTLYGSRVSEMLSSPFILILSDLTSHLERLVNHSGIDTKGAYYRRQHLFSRYGRC